ncbi:transcriptional repressor [Variovorax sp. Sphag1AA]|uniref:transcriptional repressor n=1 Tax=Variovorax sp. Sphag1AA TaxID=2587027 RepID=UPI0017A98849|nr:Fe2+ or Zn2+ uptake regulation protein [Variovorax sp. Sphag1AA]
MRPAVTPLRDDWSQLRIRTLPVPSSRPEREVPIPDLLRSVGLRPTQARIRILGAIQACGSESISAEELARRLLLKGGKGVTTGTLYRSLHDLRTSGLVACEWYGARKSLYCSRRPTERLLRQPDKDSAISRGSRAPAEFESAFRCVQRAHDRLTEINDLGPIGHEVRKLLVEATVKLSEFEASQYCKPVGIAT